MEYTYASYDYVETLGLELVAGRSLSRAFAADSLAVLLNEQAVQQLGLDHPVGAQLEWPGEGTYTIIGVLKDFHITSLHREIGAVALLGPDPRNTNRPNLLTAARLRTDNLPQTLTALEQTWNRFASQEPFVYTFLDETFAQLYKAEQRTRRLITFFAGLAILIACIGLFGLAAYIAEQRTKEIGIRKVFGATVSSIVMLLSKEFVGLVFVAIVLGIPLAYLMMQRWLETFAYRVEISWPIFLVAGLTALGVAILSVSYQSIKAALANPVDALRHE
jgi:putative ABC transport system permease protein